MANSKGYVISIGVADNATPGLNKINQGMEKLDKTSAKVNQKGVAENKTSNQRYKDLGKGIGDFEKFSKSALEKVNKMFEGTTKSIGGAVGAMGTLAKSALGLLGTGGLIAGGLVAVLAAVTLGVEKLGNKLANMGKESLKMKTLGLETGLTQGQVRAYRQSFRILGNVDEGTTDEALKNLAQKKLEIERGQFSGGQDVQSWLLSKGIDQKAAKGQSTADFEKNILTEVSKVKDPRLQAKILDAFGLSGLKPAILGHSPEEIKKTIDERQKVNEGLGIDKTNDSLNKFRESWEKLTIAFEDLGMKMLPKIIPLIDSFTKGVEGLSNWIDHIPEKLQSISDAFGKLFSFITDKIAAIAKWLGISTGGHPDRYRHGNIFGPSKPHAWEKDIHKDKSAEAPGLVEKSWNGLKNWWNGTGSNANTGASTHGAARRARGVVANDNAQPGVAYTPGAIKKTMGISDEQYSAMTGGIAQIEHARYDQMGGSSGRFAGRYQMGAAEIADTARQLGEKAPTQDQFLHDPAMQERFMEAYTAQHHKYLMKNSEKYRNMSPEEQMKILGYAHNQGAGGAAKYLASGETGRDAFGTDAQVYGKAIGSRLAQIKQTQVANATAEKEGQKMQAQLDVNFANAPPGMRSGLKVISGDPSVTVRTQRAMADLGNAA